MFKCSEQTDKLDEALSKAQGEIEEAAKDSDNPFFKSKYADLASVTKACKAALSKHGISRSQWPVHTEDDRLHVITRLACAGQWMQSEWSIPISKLDPQGYVAALTYCRRGALAAACGVAPDDDDDGNHAAQFSNGAAGKRAQEHEQAKKQSAAELEAEQLAIFNPASEKMRAAKTEADIKQIGTDAKNKGLTGKWLTDLRNLSVSCIGVLKSAKKPTTNDFMGRIPGQGTREALTLLSQEIENSGLPTPEIEDLLAHCFLQGEKIDKALAEPAHA